MLSPGVSICGNKVHSPLSIRRQNLSTLLGNEQHTTEPHWRTQVSRNSILVLHQSLVSQRQDYWYIEMDRWKEEVQAR